MCIILGSVDVATSVCPVCKVFPHSRCPHVRDICRNRIHHPRFDVYFLKNAEVLSFNGCGYCKWAQKNPPSRSSSPSNPGWPGCCRAPLPTEHASIHLTDWQPVSKIHNIPIPPEIRAILDSLPKTPAVPVNTSRSSKPTSADRKNGVNGSPPGKSHHASTKASSGNLPSKARSGSPKQMTSRSLSTGPTSSPALPSSSDNQRRHTTDVTDRQSQSVHSSPNRKILDLEATPRRESGSRRLSTSNASKPVPTERFEPKSQTNSTAEARRRLNKGSPPSSRANELPVATPERFRDTDNVSSASSSSGSDSLGSLTDSTITSEGGFTDYLSDESDAELQRQAEAKAAILAQMQVEEMEFRAARQQLAHIDLRPPRSWNPSSNSGSRVAGITSAGGT